MRLHTATVWPSVLANKITIETADSAHHSIVYGRYFLDVGFCYLGWRPPVRLQRAGQLAGQALRTGGVFCAPDWGDCLRRAFGSE
jgi:hypothetical protein